MKNYQTLLSILFTVLMLNTAKAQNLIGGVVGNIGFSKVTSAFFTPGDFKVKFALSGNFGVFLEKRISQKSSLGMEALWVQMEGKEVSKDRTLMAFDGQQLVTVGVISDESRLHISYLGLPFYYRIELGKVSIKAGVQSLLFLFANASYEGRGELYGEPFSTESKTKDIDLKSIDIGPKVGLDYQLNNRFRLRADYYYGLTDITSSEFSFQRKNQQLCVGGNYLF
jgi:hypothetical protein